MKRVAALTALAIRYMSLHAETSLPVVGSLGTGPAMDVAVDGERAFVIGRGKLHVLDVREPARPKALGSLDGLGNTRQIAVSEDVAYVSARESGLFIVDVREATPKLITHYDSIEFATGVAVAGKVLFIAQRHFGVELVDVSDPQRPRHLSTIRTGEAQSVAYHDGLLYTGVWGTSEVVTADVCDPQHPRILSKVPLDGYGDGVFVHEGKLYVATGHHSRAPHGKPDDPGFGMGHGMEVFSLADPTRPSFLGRVKFPRFYEVGFDMWDVQVVGHTAFVSDTHNGFFVVDVADPAAPRITSRNVLPKPSAEAKLAGFVGGFGLVNDHIYLAGGDTALHVVEAKGVARPVREVLGKVPALPATIAPADEQTYRPDGQVHAVALHGDMAVVACGRAGLHTLRVGENFTLLHAQPTHGVVTDVCISNGRVFAAEGMAGLSEWSVSSDGGLTEVGRYVVKGKPVKYVSVPTPGRFALAQVGGSTLHILDVSDPRALRRVLEDTQHGLLYGHQLSDQLIAGRYAAAFWHASGVHWYDLGSDQPAYLGNQPAGSLDPLSGLAVLGTHVITTAGGGIVSFDQTEQRSLAALSPMKPAGVRISGKPTVHGTRVALANRAFGDVFLLETSAPEQLELLERFTLDGNPGRVAFTDRAMLIPAGYEGLLKKPLLPKPSPR